jgi:hypothetical protein
VRFIDQLSKKDQAKLCPSEEREQAVVCRWLDINGIQYFAVPNGGARSKATAGKLKATGVKPGIPDIIIVDRPTKCHIPEGHLPHPPGAGHRGQPCGKAAVGVALEMKRMVGGRLSPEQREWMLKLEQLGWITLLGNGAAHAIEQLTALGYNRRTS